MSANEDFGAKLAGFVREARLYGAAAVVVHAGELAWSGGVGLADLASGRPAGPDTLYRIASITKTFTATAIMRLRDAGQLDLDDPAVQWLPELAASGSPQTIGRVTIRRLLSHESGLTGEPPGTDFGSASPVYEGDVTATLARVAEIFTAIGPNLQPKYSNLGYQLLGEIVHRASGTPYTTYVQQEILRPLGLADTAFEPLPDSLRARCATGYSARTFSDELTLAPDITAFAEGGLWSTAHDLGRWLSFQLSAHADEPQDSPVLAAASLREMHKPRYLSDETWTQAWGVSWYAVRKDDVTWVQHSGGLHGFTSGACFDRDKRVGAVVFVNGIGDAQGLAMELAAAARGQVQASGPRPPASTPAEYAALLGLYMVPSYGELIRIEWRDGKLTVLDSLHQEQHLAPAGAADTFTVGPGFRASGETVRFRRLADGRIAECYIGGETMVRLGPVEA